MSEQVWLVVVLWQIEEVQEPIVIQVGEFQPIPSKMLPSYTHGFSFQLSLASPPTESATPSQKLGFYICSCTQGLGLWRVR